MARFLIGFLGFCLWSACALAASPRGVVCEFPDLGSVSAVPFQSGATAPAGTGGDLPGGRWELVAMYYDSPSPIAGTAVAALELDAETASAGFGSLALDVSVTSPDTLDFSETGAGPYVAVGSNLNFANDCGEALTLGDVEYSVDASAATPVLTLWGALEFEVELFPGVPVTVTVGLEAEFELVEAQTVEDPVFADRFE